MLRTLAVALAAFACSATAAHAGPANDLLRAHLEGGTLTRGEDELAAYQAAHPHDPEAVYALGAAQFTRAFERLGQGLYRHGLQSPGVSPEAPPLLRLPVPPNPSPEPMTYEGLRGLLDRFVRDLDAANATLARVDNARVKLRLDLARVRLDLNADGAPDGPGDFEAMLGREAESPPAAKAGGAGAAAPSREIAFDRADALWMRGYANLFAAQADFVLAHDFHDMFDASFHVLFPRAGLPMSRLQRSDPNAPMIGGNTGIADAIAAIHTLNWPVIDRDRRARVRMRLLEVSRLSRQTWAQVRRERDNDHEWLPGPRQTSPFSSLVVTDETIAGWMQALDLWDGVLNGEILAPHWRFAQGVDVRAYLESDAPFDLVAIVAGYGVAPYLKDGRKLTTEELQAISARLGSNPFAIAAWFN